MACQCHQLFRLCRAGSQRLFHDDVFPGLQRHPHKTDVLQVGHGNVHHIHPLQQLQIVGGVLRHAILSAQLLCLFGAAGRAAQCLHRKRRVFHEPRQKFLHDLARAKNAHFHVVLPILSLIVSQPTSASGSRRVRFLGYGRFAWGCPGWPGLRPPAAVWRGAGWGALSWYSKAKPFMSSSGS